MSNKGDINHRDLSRGKMLLQHQPTGQRRLLTQMTAFKARRAIERIKKLWASGQGPKKTYPNHHKHVDAFLMPFFEDTLVRTPLLIEGECDTHKVGKPWRTPGGSKKFAVCADGKLVRFGDPNMSIKRDSPERRKNFRARHNCASPGPRTKAKYWACRTWEKTRTVGDVVD